MQRVLMVGPVPPPEGGIASVVRDIMSSDLGAEFKIDLFERSAPSASDPTGPVGRNLFRLRRFLRFFRRVRQGNYRIVHIHSADPAFMGTIVFMFLARLAGAKVLLHMHGTDWDDFYTNLSRFRQFLTRMGLGLATMIVVLYSLWEHEIRRLRPTARVRVVRNLVHPRNPPDPEQIRAVQTRAGLAGDNFVVLTVGSVGHRKGSFDILRSVPLVARQDDSVRFVFVGGEEKPGEMAELTEIVERERLGPWVLLLGEVDRAEVPCFLGFADVFLLPSFVEGMPISIIEALRGQVPVISTRVGGIPDMVEDGHSGLLICPGAPEQIADAILKLKHDPDLRVRIARNGRKIFEEKFEFSAGIDEIRALYRTIGREQH